MSILRIKIQVGDDKKSNSYQKTNVFRKFFYVSDSLLNTIIDEFIRT